MLGKCTSRLSPFRVSQVLWFLGFLPAVILLGGTKG